MGFGKVAAFDYDPVAIGVSRKNAELNDLGGRVDFYAGDLVMELAGRQAELVLANIQADVLGKFARELLNTAAPGGPLAMSSILATELAQVRKTFKTLVPG